MVDIGYDLEGNHFKNKPKIKRSSKYERIQIARFDKRNESLKGTRKAILLFGVVKRPNG